MQNHDIKISKLKITHQKSYKFLVGFPITLLASCNLVDGEYQYCPTGFCYVPAQPEPIEIPEISFEPLEPKQFTEISANVFIAGDDNDHEMDESGSSANITVSGKDGDDVIYTGSGDDVINTGGGLNIVRSSGGNDRITGSVKFDHITAGDGSDVINAGGGDDWLFGQNGNDQIFGQDGEDRIWGGDGFDQLYGGNGDDEFIVKENENSHYEDTFDGGIGNDVIKFEVTNSLFQMEVDLSLVNAIDIEILNLNDNDNSVSLEFTLDDILDVTDSDNIIYIRGAEDDAVTSLGQGWVQEADFNIYNVYTAGDATLYVDQDIIQTIS